jgi:uncharacterized RDD family membrane protein YckC
MKKRFLIAGLAAAAVFATVLGVAASLTVNSGALGAGGTSVSSCDTVGVNTSYMVTWTGSPPGFRVTGVTVSDIDGCDQHKVQVALLGSSSSVLATSTTKTVSGSSNASVSFTGSELSAQPLAADVISVQVTIYKE